MNGIIFDCSQFIFYHRSDEITFADFNGFLALGFDILMKDEIGHFAKQTGITKLMVIFTPIVSTDSDENRIVIKEVSYDKLYAGLIEISKWGGDPHLFLTIRF